MLNKAVCIKCRKRVLEKYKEKINCTEDISWWNEEAEKEWKEGSVKCIIITGESDFRKTWSYISETVNHCPYKLEHILQA